MKRRRKAFLSAIPLLAASHLAPIRPAHGKSSFHGPKSHGPSAVTKTQGEPAVPDQLEWALHAAAPTLRISALRAALASWNMLRERGEVSRPRLTVIDYSLPSTVKRLWVFDLASPRLLFHELVAHGRGSGEDIAHAFSNREGSLMTSLGAFATGTTYAGKNGYSLHLTGLERGLNDQAEARTIVMHGAPYVGEEFARKVGRLGRSHGCPALRPEIAHDVIDEIKDRTLLYAWHPSLGGEGTGVAPAADRAAPALTARGPEASTPARSDGPGPTSESASPPVDPSGTPTR